MKIIVYNCPTLFQGDIKPRKDLGKVEFSARFYANNGNVYPATIILKITKSTEIIYNHDKKTGKLTHGNTES